MIDCDPGLGQDMKHNLSRTSFIPWPGVLGTPKLPVPYLSSVKFYLNQWCCLGIAHCHEISLAAPKLPGPSKFRFTAWVKVIRRMIKCFGLLNRSEHLTKTPLACTMANKVDKHHLWGKLGFIKIISSLNGKLEKQTFCSKILNVSYLFKLQTSDTNY